MNARFGLLKKQCIGNSLLQGTLAKKIINCYHHQSSFPPSFFPLWSHTPIAATHEGEGKTSDLKKTTITTRRHGETVEICVVMALHTIAAAAAAAAAARKSRRNKEQVGAGGDKKKGRPLHVSAKNVSTAQFLTTSYHILLHFTTVYHIVLRPNTCNSLHRLTTSLVGLQGILPMLIKPTTPQHCRAELTHYPTGLLENKPPRRSYSCCLIKF